MHHLPTQLSLIVQKKYIIVPYELDGHIVTQVPTWPGSWKYTARQNPQSGYFYED